MKRLIKDDILHDLDFSDFGTCVDCIKGKLTAKTRKERTQRSQQVLELVHTDICGPFTPIAIGGYKYFITFIDDFSRYGHVELLTEKSESLSVFKPLRLMLSSKRVRKLKQQDQTNVVSIMGDMIKLGVILDLLLNCFRNVE